MQRPGAWRLGGSVTEACWAGLAGIGIGEGCLARPAEICTGVCRVSPAEICIGGAADPARQRYAPGPVGKNFFC
ncbi:hypothetical protein P0G10_02145 [Eubacteriales bacterium DFI.9.88]|nr:hypothetical protein [Eubacteriales bacterium DFI.9.88]